MKFKVNSLELINMMKVATKGHDSRDNSSFVYLKLEKETNVLKIVSKSPSAYFSGEVPVANLELEDDEPFIYYVDGEVLKKLIGIFPAAPIQIEFSMDKKARVFVIKYTGNKFRLPIISDSNEITPPLVKNLGMVQASELMNVFNSLLKIVDNSPTAQEHPSSCLHLTISDDKLKLMGTDRFTIAELTKTFSNETENKEDETILIKHPQAILLNKTANPAEVLKLVSSDEYFGYYDGSNNLSLVGRTNLSPLNYSSIMALAGDDNKITMKTADLRDALSTISKIAFLSNSVLINIHAEEKTLEVSSVAGDTITIPIQDLTIDEDTSVGFTRTILQEALLPIDTEDVRLEWPNNSAATIYKLVPVENGKEEKDIFVGVVSNG